MRYFLQGLGMVAELLFCFMVGYFVFYVAFEYFDSRFALLLSVVVALKAFQDWKQFRFMAWRPKGIRSFLTNAKRAGL